MSSGTFGGASANGICTLVYCGLSKPCIVQFDGTGSSDHRLSSNPAAAKSAGAASGEAASAKRQSPFSERTHGEGPRASACAASG